MKNFLLSYGTLRKGDEFTNKSKTYNYERFGENTQKFIKKFRLKGFSLVDLGFYPAAVEDKNGEITVELQEIENEGVWKNLYHMEKGAGYLSKNIEIDGVKATIYFMTRGTAGKYPKIPSGDWCE